MRSAVSRAKAKSVLLAATLACALPTAGSCVDIELKDVASDRVERQRAYNRGQVPLPSTPDLAKLGERLQVKGLKLGNPIYIRVFKASSELEVWMQKGDRFVLLDTYPVCHWTGTLGPKLREGDRQSPEGFYSVAYRQMRLVGRWQKAFNLGFPNHFDQMNKRTGSFILVHGGCSSVGCFAMTEQVQEEIFSLADAAVKGGQDRFQVHVFPFRMTDQAMEAFSGHTWAPFWRDLKVGHDSFERTRVPPKVNLCESRYHITDGEPGYVGDQKQIGILNPRSAAAAAGAGGSCAVDGNRIPHQTQAATLIETGSVSDAVPSAAARSEPNTQTRRQPKAEAKPEPEAPQKVAVKKRSRSSSDSANSTGVAAPGRVEQPNGFGGADRKGSSKLVTSAD